MTGRELDDAELELTQRMNADGRSVETVVLRQVEHVNMMTQARKVVQVPCKTGTDEYTGSAVILLANKYQFEQEVDGG